MALGCDHGRERGGVHWRFRVSGVGIGGRSPPVPQSGYRQTTLEGSGELDVVSERIFCECRIQWLVLSLWDASFRNRIRRTGEAFAGASVSSQRLVFLVACPDSLSSLSAQTAMNSV